MKMSVMKKEKRYQWGFMLTSAEMYQLSCHIVCSVVARQHPHLLKDMDFFQKGVIRTVKTAKSLDEEELESCKDPFLRMVFVELKRLGIDLMAESRAEHED